jgi:hypothetical protein
MNTFTDRQSSLIARTIQEAHCTWVTRFCAGRKIICQPEWLEPIDGPPMGPIARARQDRALAKMQMEK